MNFNNGNSDASDLGCVILIGMVILPFVLQALFVALLPYLLIGAVGFIGYRILIYDKRTGNITLFIEEQLNIGDGKRNNELPEADVMAELPSPREDALKEINELKDRLKEVELKNEEKIEQKLEKYANNIDRKNKETLLKDVFGNESNPIEYTRSDEYEYQKLKKSKEKKEDELSIRELKQEIKEQLFDFRNEGREERFLIKEQIKDNFMYLQMEFTTLKGFVTEKVAYLDARISTEIANVKKLIGDLRVELKGDLADFKVQVGREIVRVDSYMIQIVGKLESYNTRVEKFSHQVRQVKLDADRSQVRAERMLNQTQNLYANHKADLKILSKDIDLAVGKMALHNSDFSTKVARSKLMLDRASMEQVNAVKELASERIGIDLLRNDHLNKQRESDLKMQNYISEQKHVEERMKQNQNNYEKLNSLKFQLNMNQERLGYERSRNNIMRQEFTLLNRLS